MSECRCNPPVGSALIYCERHQCEKTRVLWDMCQKRGRMWKAWEEGRGVGQGHRNPVHTKKIAINPNGPGTELTKIIAGWQKMFPWFNLSPNGGCSCKATAQWMDKAGVDGCEKHMDTILDKLEEEAKKRKLSIPFQRFWAKRMVKQAIRRARLKHSPI